MTLQGNTRIRKTIYNKYKKLIEEDLMKYPEDINILLAHKVIELRNDGFVDWIKDSYSGVFNVYKEPFKLNYVMWKRDKDNNIKLYIKII